MIRNNGKKLLLAVATALLVLGAKAQNPTYRLVPVVTPTNTVNNRATEVPKAQADPKTTTLQDRYAAMLKVLPQALSEVNLYKYVDEWLGVKYRLGGSSKSGIDCSAFVQKVYENVFGMNMVRTAWQQFNACVFQKSTDELNEGDLVFFRINSSRITHVGIYLRNNYFIHASCSKGVTISNLKDSYWSRYYAGGGKVAKANNKEIAEAMKELKKRL